MATTTTATTNPPVIRVIDSHLHIWANTAESESAFPYVQDPPDALRGSASVDALLQRIQETTTTTTRSNNYNEVMKVVGALIVQPINHQYDHSYVRQALRQYPHIFKGMMLHDPLLSTDQAINRLEELVLAGFVGVRFNPYLWPPPPPSLVESVTTTTNDDDSAVPSSLPERPHQLMSTTGSAGLAVYKRCGELRVPVGIMCFRGLQYHYDDIIQLITQSPQTILILDHFAFTTIGEDENEDDKTTTDGMTTPFEQLLSLAQYPCVHVKISALFRLGDTSPTFDNVFRQRFVPLLQAYGYERLLYGSDFPYILQEPHWDYNTIPTLVASWCPDDTSRRAILGGNAERLFGPWGVGGVE